MLINLYPLYLQNKETSMTRLNIGSYEITSLSSFDSPQELNISTLAESQLGSNHSKLADPMSSPLET